jgi:hypothetical protein
MQRLNAVGAAVALSAPLLFGAATPAAAADPSYREIKDWILACDNGGTCQAKFVLDDMAPTGALPDNASQGYLAISREAGPDGKLIVATQSMADVEHAAFDGAKMDVDGKPLTAAWGTDADGNMVLSGDAARALLAAVADGKVLTFPNNGAPQMISLVGLKAVLLAMDDAQGRVGTVTALARAGDKPASAVPAAPELPEVISAPATGELSGAEAVAAAVRAAQNTTLKAHECDADASQDLAYALNDREALVLLYCRMAAYQGSVLLYRAPRAAPAKAVIVRLPLQPTLKPEDADTQGEYVEGAWDEKTATFTEAAKGRGLADCGLSTDWVFDGQDFHIASFTRQERCGGPPGDWPSLYRSTVKPKA